MMRQPCSKKRSHAWRRRVSRRRGQPIQSSNTPTILRGSGLNITAIVTLVIQIATLEYGTVFLVALTTQTLIDEEIPL